MTETGRLPDVLICGAPRSGTSWLHTLLASHPKTYVPIPFKPEPKFFLVDAEYARGLDYYSERWFSNVPEAVVACEKSANYLESPVVARRIAADLPEVRLIFTLRDPADRALSNYLWSRMNGLETEDFATAIRLEETRERSYPEKHRFSRPHSYFSRGLYAQHLRPYLDLFGRERILVVRYEDISNDPQALAKQVLGFMGVELGTLDVTSIGTVNAAQNEARADEIGEFERTLSELRERYREPNTELYSLLGKDFYGWGD